MCTTRGYDCYLPRDLDHIQSTLCVYYFPDAMEWHGGEARRGEARRYRRCHSAKQKQERSGVQGCDIILSRLQHVHMQFLSLSPQGRRKSLVLEPRKGSSLARLHPVPSLPSSWDLDSARYQLRSGLTAARDAAHTRGPASHISMKNWNWDLVLGTGPRDYPAPGA